MFLLFAATCGYRQCCTAIYGFFFFLAVVSLQPSSVHAANFSLTGNLVVDNSVRYFEFTLSQTQTVVIQTDSYALSNGFDPVLTLFDGDGFWLATNDNKAPGFDSEIIQSLDSGRYILAISQSGNIAVADGQPTQRLAAGFTRAAPSGFGGRLSFLSVDIFNVDDAYELADANVPVVPPDSNRFLKFRNEVSPAHRETEASANAYYAVIDPSNSKTTLAAWKTINHFDTGDDASAIYVNDADLGFGRHMHVKSNGDDFASYVENYSANVLDPTDPGAGSIDEKVANAHNATNLLATVAMDYSAHPSDPNNRRFTKFYVFDANGDRINKIDLDGRGAKYVPGACNVCHGGNPTPLDQDGLYPDFGNTGAGFLPWDLDVLGFSTTVVNGQYTRKNQEAELRQMNQAILNTNPTATTRDLVEGWYGGAGLPNATYNGQYVPLGWQSEPKYYLDVYGPNCRACHIMRNEAVDFSSSTEFHAFDLRIRNMVFNYGVMPLAKRTYQRFWTLPVSTLDIASNNALGLQGDNFVFDLAISNNGRYVVYGSQSENQFSGDSNGRTDIHLKDVLTNELFWVSTSSVGLASDQNSRAPVVSDDGRYVVFESHGSTLVAPDTNNAAEIFIKDTQAGALSVVSSSSAGVRGINSQQYSARPAVTPEGRYVAFTSNFGGLVANDTNFKTDIFVKDVLTGSIVRVSTSSVGAEGDGFSDNADISDDGRYIVFQSTSTNLGGNTSGDAAIYRKDILTGALVLVSSSASSETANAFSTNPRISGDGRYVVFQSQATNLVNTSDTNGVEDIFWKDMDTGEVYLVSSSHSGEIGLAASQDATVSDDGKLVVFRSGASNLVLGDTNGSTDIFLKHTDSGEIKRISVTSAGLEDPSGSYYSALSGDGGAIIFSSYGTGLIQPDINGSADVFLYDRAGRTAAASPLFLPYVPTAPGEPGPFSFAGIDQLAITNQSVALDANNSSMTNAMSGNTGYQWSLLSVPAGSTVSLNSSSPTPDFVPDIAGSYELRLTAENGQEVSDDEMIIYVTDNGAPTTEMIDFVADVYPVFNSRCATACHSAGGVAPSFDAPVVAGVVETLYRHFYSRVDVMDVANSLLLQKPLGQLNHGGSTVFASTVDTDYQTLARWIAQGASRQITLPTAANSDFAAAELIIGDVIVVSGSTFNAGVEPGEPMHANISGGNSVWYLWTPLATGVFQFDLTSTDFNTLLAVYTGSSIDELTTVAFNDDTAGTDSQLVFQAIEGESYYIAVDSHGGTGGEFTLTLDGPLPIGAVNIPFVPYSAQIALFFMLFTLAYRCRALKG